MTTTELDAQRKSTALQQLDTLNKRLEGLNTRRTRVQVQLETARQQYAEAVAEAERDHKTSNLDELRQKLVKLEAENTQAVTDFATAISEYERYIEKIEQALANPEVMAELLAVMPPVAAATPAPAPSSTSAPQFDAEDI